MHRARVYIFLFSLVLLASCGGGSANSPVVAVHGGGAPSCEFYVTGTVVDTLTASPVNDRTQVTLEASYFTLANIVGYRPVSSAAPAANGAFSLCVPAGLAAGTELLVALASSDRTGGLLNTGDPNHQYPPTVIPHITAGDIGQVPVAGILSGIPLGSAKGPTILTGGVGGADQPVVLWVLTSINDPADATKTLAIAVPELAGYERLQVLGGNVPVNDLVTSQAPAVKTTVMFNGTPQTAYVTSAAAPVYDAVAAPAACVATGTSVIARTDTTGHTMIAVENTTYNFGQIPLHTCP